MKANAKISGISYFYNYIFFSIQKFYQKIGAGKGSIFYAWLILSSLECLNILSIFYILILTSTINVQKLGNYKLYILSLICLFLNAIYFFRKKNSKEIPNQFGAIPNVKVKRWQTLLIVYIVFSLVAFAVLMILVRIHLREISPKDQNILPFPMRQK